MVTKAQVIDLLQTNDKAIARALVALNERQTASERNSQATFNDNGEGFVPCDARMGTSMAEFYTRYGRLSEKQLAYWKRTNVRGVMRICKYAGQLVRIAEAKAAAKIPTVVAVDVSQDIGNLLEEQMVLEERLEGYLEGAMGDEESDAAAMRVSDRIMQIREQIEEMKRCEFKMNREFALAA